MSAKNINYALRHLIKSPGFTVVCIITLGIGIGANAAIFSVINAVIFHPSGINQPQRVAILNVRHTRLGLDTPYVSVPDYLDAVSLTAQVEAAAIARNVGVNITQGNSMEHLLGERVSSKWFEVYGTRPLLGRTFTAEEDQSNAAPVVVISYALWQTMFGSNPGIVGQKIFLDQQPYEVIGVTEPNFSEPRDKQIWVPMALPRTALLPNQRFNEDYICVLRLRPGASLEQLNAGLAQKVSEAMRQLPGNSYATESGWSMYANRFTEFAVQPLRTPLRLLFAFVALILLIASANVAELLLVRSAGRSQDFVIQIALGARPSTLVAQIFTESFFLSLGAVVIGIVAGPSLGKLLLVSLPLRISQGLTIHTDLSVLAFTAGIGFITSLVAGLGPIIRILNDGKNLRMNERDRSRAGSVVIHRLHNSFVIGQVAFACLLLSGAGFFLISLRQLQQIDLGFNTRNLLTAQVVYSGQEFKSNASQQASFVSGVVDQLAAQPGVLAAGGVEPLPFDPDRVEFSSFSIDTQPVRPNEPGYQSSECYATPGYLTVMGIPLLEGRWFTNEDRAETTPVVVIDEMLRRKYWPNRDPIGQRLKGGNNKPWTTIVGIVGSIHSDLLEGQRADGIRYYPFTQGSDIGANFVVRSANPHDGFIATAKKAVAAIRPDQAVSSATPMTTIISNLLAGRKIIVYILTIFASIAVLLAVLSIYGLTSYLTTRRTHEIGIRIALGAQRLNVVWLILSKMLQGIFLGLCAGILMSFATLMILRHEFVAFGEDAVAVITIAALLLLLTGIIAILSTAYRAAFIEPARAMQYE